MLIDLNNTINDLTTNWNTYYKLTGQTPKFAKAGQGVWESYQSQLHPSTRAVDDLFSSTHLPHINFKSAKVYLDPSLGENEFFFYA